MGSDVVECRYCLEPINWVEKKRVTEHVRSQKHLKAKMAAMQGLSASASASAGPLDRSATSGQSQSGTTSAKILNDNAADSIQDVPLPEDLSDNDDECDNVNDISDREAGEEMLGPPVKRRRLRAPTAAEAATAAPVVTLASRLKGQFDRQPVFRKVFVFKFIPVGTVSVAFPVVCL